jgi:hypothetical protein
MLDRTDVRLEISLKKIVCSYITANGGKCKASTKYTKTAAFSPFKDETRLFYIRTQSVPRSEHSPLRLYKTYLLMMSKLRVHTEHLNITWAPSWIFECWMLNLLVREITDRIERVNACKETVTTVWHSREARLNFVNWYFRGLPFGETDSTFVRFSSETSSFSSSSSSSVGPGG